MIELENYNITKFESEQIADLIRSKGFEEHDEITLFHPGFVQTEEYFAMKKESMTEEEREEMMREMKDMLDYAKGLEGVNDDVKLDDRTETLMAAHSAYHKIQRQKQEAERLRAQEGISMNDALDLLNFENTQKRIRTYKNILGIQASEADGKDVLYGEFEDGVSKEMLAAEADKVFSDEKIENRNQA